MTKAKISNIMETKCEDTEYSLLEMTVNEKVKYALCISRGSETEFDILDDNRESCEKLLNQAAAHRLSPIHIEDVANDYKRELLDRRVEIF